VTKQDAGDLESLTEEDLFTLYRVFLEIGILSQLSSSAMRRVLPKGLSMAQFGVLNHMVRVRSVSSPLRLARAFQVTKGAMSQTVKSLERQGFVRVSPDPKDARGKLVEITEAGRAAREDAIRAVFPSLAKLGKDFGIARFRRLLPHLEALRILLDQDRDERDFGDL